MNKPPQLSTPLDDEVDKKPYMILDDAFTCGVNLTAYDWPDYKDLKPGMLKALDKAYAKQFLELMPEKREVLVEKKGWTPAKKTIPSVIEAWGYNEAIDQVKAAVNKVVGAQDES